MLADSDKRAKYDKSGRYDGDGGEEELDMDDFFKVALSACLLLALSLAYLRLFPAFSAPL